MNNADWQEEIAGRFLANGLPFPYVKRLVRELDDHRAGIAAGRPESSSPASLEQRLAEPPRTHRSYSFCES
jgi:hypothetical protein